MHPDLPVASNALPVRLLTWLSAPAVLRAGIAAAFAIFFVLAYWRNVNWDEFFFLSHVHAHLDGRLNRPLQTAFVHAFGWIEHVPGHEMEQIFAARLLMIGFLGVTCYALFRISQSLSDTRSALIAVFAFVMSGYVLPHGPSFRADPMAAAGLMSALAIAMTARMSPVHIAALAVLLALSLLVTIKAVFYFPAFLGALLWRGNQRGVPLRIFVAGCLSVLLAGGLYALHSAGVEPKPGRDTVSSAGDALNTALLENRLLTRWNELAFWALLSIGSIGLATWGIGTAGTRRLTLALFAFALPFVLSMLFYRNAFPYFFPYIVPPLMVAVAVGAARLGQGVVLGAFLIVTLVSGVVQVVWSLSEDARLQRATIAEVHRLFPAPVPYIDANGMISSFPRSAFFMSGWGLERYRSAGLPALRIAIERDRPPLLLANRWALDNAMNDPGPNGGWIPFFPEDLEALRETYIHYSGAIWLAGTEVTLGAEPTTVALPFPGTYRLEGAAAIQVDGRTVPPGGTVSVDEPIRVSGPEGASVRLVWDTGSPPRPDALPDGELYAGFRRF